jgi:hypothetical protein
MTARYDDPISYDAFKRGVNLYAFRWGTLKDIDPAKHECFLTLHGGHKWPFQHLVVPEDFTIYSLAAPGIEAVEYVAVQDLQKRQTFYQQLIQDTQQQVTDLQADLNAKYQLDRTTFINEFNTLLGNKDCMKFIELLDTSLEYFRDYRFIKRIKKRLKYYTTKLNIKNEKVNEVIRFLDIMLHIDKTRTFCYPAFSLLPNYLLQTSHHHLDFLSVLYVICQSDPNESFLVDISRFTQADGAPFPLSRFLADLRNHGLPGCRFYLMSCSDFGGPIKPLYHLSGCLGHLQYDIIERPRENLALRIAPQGKRYTLRLRRRLSRPSNELEPFTESFYDLENPFQQVNFNDWFFAFINTFKPLSDEQQKLMKPIIQNLNEHSKAVHRETTCMTPSETRYTDYDLHKCIQQEYDQSEEVFTILDQGHLYLYIWYYRFYKYLSTYPEVMNSNEVFEFSYIKLGAYQVFPYWGNLQEGIHYFGNDYVPSKYLIEPLVPCLIIVLNEFIVTTATGSLVFDVSKLKDLVKNQPKDTNFEDKKVYQMILFLISQSVK